MSNQVFSQPGQNSHYQNPGNQNRFGGLTGKWQAHSINGIQVNFPVEINSNMISFIYCNHKNMPYMIQGNQIRI